MTLVQDLCAAAHQRGQVLICVVAAEVEPVSYTHLDVYKRQMLVLSRQCLVGCERALTDSLIELKLSLIHISFLAYFDTAGASNGPTEAINGIIELGRRTARGYRNPTNYQLRMLLIAGGLDASTHTQL